MIISNMRVGSHGDQVVASAQVDSAAYGSTAIWFKLSGEHAERIVDDRFDAFVVAMLYPAMTHGEDIEVRGAVSERLLFGLRDAVALVRTYSNALKPVRIRADRVCSRGFQGPGVGMSFSGGVDSFCTLYDRYVTETLPSFRVNSLLFFNTGSHGDWVQNGSEEFARRKFRARLAHIKPFADELGIECVDVDTNLHFFHRWDHNHSHTLKDAAVMLLLQKHYSTFFYPSAGFGYAEGLELSRHYRGKAVAYLDPILLPLLSSDSLQLISDGACYRRSEKLLRVADYAPAQRLLNVCVADVDDWKNCSGCSKCLRTLMSLDLSRNLPKFASLFDLDKYEARKSRYFAKQLEMAPTDAFAADNVELAARMGIDLSRLVQAAPIPQGTGATGLPQRILHRLKRLVSRP